MILEFIFYYVIKWFSFYFVYFRFGDINNKGWVGVSVLFRVVCGWKNKVKICLLFCYNNVGKVKLINKIYK